jgi:hypothetical protein
MIELYMYLQSNHHLIDREVLLFSLLRLILILFVRYPTCNRIHVPQKVVTIMEIPMSTTTVILPI